MRRVVGVTGAVVVAYGLGLAVVAHRSGSKVDPILGFIALGAVVAAPGMLAVIGLADRTCLWLPASLAAAPLAFLSFAGLSLPLLPAAVVFMMAWVTRPADPPVHSYLLTPVVVALLLAAALALFATQDPETWKTDVGGGATSDVITNVEASGSLVLTGSALAAAWKLAGQPRRRPRLRRL